MILHIQKNKLKDFQGIQKGSSDKKYEHHYYYLMVHLRYYRLFIWIVRRSRKERMEGLRRHEGKKGSKGRDEESGR